MVRIYTDFSEDYSPEQSVYKEDDMIDISALERMSTLQPDELNVLLEINKTLKKLLEMSKRKMSYSFLKIYSQLYYY